MIIDYDNPRTRKVRRRDFRRRDEAYALPRPPMSPRQVAGWKLLILYVAFGGLLICAMDFVLRWAE